jgi:hypothetical protein
LFVPIDYDRNLLAACGLQLLIYEDVTPNMAKLAERRMAARASRDRQLRQIEGDESFQSQQNFFAVAARLARERRLSRFLYVAVKPA